LYQSTANDADGTVYGTTARWRDTVDYYGTLKNGISEVRLSFLHTDGTHEIVGTVAYNPNNESQLLFTPITATLPANTLPAVNAIIDPFTVSVDSIVSPATGTRYLILNPIGSPNSEPAVAWAGSAGTNLIAHANDIIMWNGQYWIVQFDSQQEPATQYVTNMNTHTQYRWTGTQWIKSYEGLYSPGEWSLVI